MLHLTNIGFLLPLVNAMPLIILLASTYGVKLIYSALWEEFSDFISMGITFQQNVP